MQREISPANRESVVDRWVCRIPWKTLPFLVIEEGCVKAVRMAMTSNIALDGVGVGGYVAVI